MSALNCPRVINTLSRVDTSAKQLPGGPLPLWLPVSPPPSVSPPLLHSSRSATSTLCYLKYFTLVPTHSPPCNSHLSWVILVHHILIPSLSEGFVTASHADVSDRGFNAPPCKASSSVLDALKGSHSMTYFPKWESAKRTGGSALSGASHRKLPPSPQELAHHYLGLKLSVSRRLLNRATYLILEFTVSDVDNSAKTKANRRRHTQTGLFDHCGSLLENLM